MSNYDAAYFSKLFVREARKPSNRRSYKHGISRGTGHIPYDTGATQQSIRVFRPGSRTCSIHIGSKKVFYARFLQFNEYVGNTRVINQHRMFVQKFTKTAFVEALKRLFGEVEVK